MLKTTEISGLQVSPKCGDNGDNQTKKKFIVPVIFLLKSPKNP